MEFLSQRADKINFRTESLSGNELLISIFDEVNYMPSWYDPYWYGRCNNTANAVPNVSGRCFLDIVFQSYCDLTWHLDTQVLMLLPSHKLVHDEKLLNGHWFSELNFCREAGMKYCPNCKSLESF